MSNEKKPEQLELDFGPLSPKFSIGGADPKETGHTTVAVILSTVKEEAEEVIHYTRLFVSDGPESKERAYALYGSYKQLALEFNRITAEFLEATDVKL